MSERNRRNAGRKHRHGGDSGAPSRPFPQSFWDSPTIEEIVRSQNVRPMEDVSVLFGTWPGDPDDGFEEAVDGLRHRHVLGAKCDE